MSDNVVIPAASGGNGPTLETRFASLESATRNLSGDVQALNATLAVVNELRIRQESQEAAQIATDVAIEAARKLAIERTARINRVVAWTASAFALLVPIVMILVYASLIAHVNDLIDQNNQIAYKACVVRNQSLADNAVREESLAKMETNPRLASVHTKSAQQLRASTSDCSTWLK